MRAAALIIQAGRIALIERRREAERYFLFPGGDVEDGESPTEAAAREVLEELGLEIDVGQLVAEVRYQAVTQLHFAATVVRRSPDAPTDPQPAVWVDTSDVLNRRIFPREVAEIVAHFHDAGWPAAPVLISDPGRDA